MKAGFVLALLASACPSSGHDLFSNPLDEVGTFQSTRQSGAADLGLLELASNQPKVPRSSPASASLARRVRLLHGHEH